MIYVVLKPIDDSNHKLCCLVNATSGDEAKQRCGVDIQSREWAGFTDEDFSVIVATKQGYIAESM